MTSRAGLAAIVLAGGASSRFGGDKMAALLDGRPILHHALAAAAEVAGTVVVVLAPGADTTSLPAGRSRLVVAHDPETHQGPLAGLAAGLSAMAQAAPEVDLAIVVGGDMPWVVPAVLRALLAALDADATLGAATLEAEPTAVLPMAVRPSMIAPVAAGLLAVGRRALRGVLARVPAGVVPATTWRALDSEAQTLRDVDLPGDLRRAR
ncbi:MAG TPA: NTP transferase domain-containing protein [Candidatus Limnocylindrales bacterium]